MKIAAMLLVVACASLSGCAFTVYDLPVNYEYHGSAVAGRDNLPAITVGTITDGRNVENPRMLMNQQNGYGQTTTGGWQAEKELAGIVQDALRQGIEKSGLTPPNSNGEVVLTGELSDISSDITSGWTSGVINTKLTVKLQAQRPNSSEILWRDTFTSDGASSRGASINKLLPEAFAKALDTLVDKVLADQYFVQQIARK